MARYQVWWGSNDIWDVERDEKVDIGRRHQSNKAEEQARLVELQDVLPSELHGSFHLTHLQDNVSPCIHISPWGLQPMFNNDAYYGDLV